jgi:hypothetical protein
MLRRSILVRIILTRTLVVNVVLVVHALGVLLRRALGLLAVEPVLALGFGELVNLSSVVSWTLAIASKKCVSQLKQGFV